MEYSVAYYCELCVHFKNDITIIVVVKQVLEFFKDLTILICGFGNAELLILIY